MHRFQNIILIPVLAAAMSLGGCGGGDSGLSNGDNQGLSDSSGQDGGRLVDGSPRPQDAEGYFAIAEKWDSTIYRNEVEARKAGKILAGLWDSMRTNPDPWSLARLLLEKTSVRFQAPGTQSEIFTGVAVRENNPEAGFTNWDGSSLAQFFGDLHTDGWRIEAMEIRQTALDISQARSRLEITVQIRNESGNGLGKYDWNAHAWVHWPNGDYSLSGAEVEILDYTLTSSQFDREPFRQIVSMEITPVREGYLIGPLCLFDLNDDMYPEIILPGANRIFWNDSGKSFRPAQMVSFPRPAMLVSMVYDIDADGAVEILTVDGSGLWQWKPDSSGQYLSPPNLLWKPDKKIRGGMCLTAGDFDRDGLVDLWVGQYKPPYENGHMPTPFYDANDGEPFFLLRQIEGGRFADVTVEAGLDTHRKRRVFGASLVDLDDDGWLDLAVISDFAGLDLYWNQQNGTFIQQNAPLGDRRYALGMSHIITDHNANGLPEIVMTGMNAPTADRLIHSSSSPDSDGKSLEMIRKMTAGNQWIEFSPDRTVTDYEPSGPWQRSGWTWGISRLDFDNDGISDYFITNGHESAATVENYESWFWCYDIHFGTSMETPAVHQYFNKSMAQTRGSGFSYTGYELNRLLKGLPDQQTLLELAYPMNLASQLDCRAAVSADFDLDGLSDIAITTFEFWPRFQQRLIVYRNTFPSSGNWVGINAPSADVFPASRFTITKSQSNAAEGIGDKSIIWLLPGQSYRSQHPWSIHVGLGDSKPGSNVSIHWKNPRDNKTYETSVPSGAWHNFKNIIWNEAVGE